MNLQTYLHKGVFRRVSNVLSSEKDISTTIFKGFYIVIRGYKLLIFY